jgi:hypothetical protein
MELCGTCIAQPVLHHQIRKILPTTAPLYGTASKVCEEAEIPRSPNSRNKARS